MKQTFETKSDGMCQQLQKEIEASGFLLEQMIEQLWSQLDDNKDSVAKLSELTAEQNFKLL